ncbi:MarR family transcriptional regulator [Oscillospiraceae bacterium 50-60]
MDPTRRRIRKIDRDAQRFVAQALGNTDLSLSDYDMIHTVRHRPGVTQEELRRLYCLDKSTIARRAAKLEEAGYIVRRTSAADKRRKELFVTEKGDALREAKVEAEAFYFRWLTAELTEAELSVLVPLLARLQLRSRDERRQEFVHLLEEYERMSAEKGQCEILPDPT